MKNNRELFFLLILLWMFSIHALESQTHFVFTENTGNNATIAVPISVFPNIGGVSISIGDEIGLFTPTGLCVGAIVWNDSNTAITCWGDNDQTENPDGISGGEKILYRLWQHLSGYEFKNVIVTYSSGDGFYHSNDICILSSFTVEGMVTIEAACLTDVCLPGTITAVANFSFHEIIGSPTIERMNIHRLGSATDIDIPKVRLYRDVNLNNEIDETDIQIDTGRCCVNGFTCFEYLHYSPSVSENLLLAFEISSDADLSNSTCASVDSNDVFGGSGTDINFHGVTTPSIPLQIGIIEFGAKVNGDNVFLTWKNASESDTYGFVVQRTNSADLLSGKGSTFLWSDVVLIERNNTRSGYQQYSYTDTHVPTGFHGYRLKHVDRDGNVYYSEPINIEIRPPLQYSLGQNYPNPFNPSTTIEYQIPKQTFVTLKIFDPLGREIATLVNEKKLVGNYSVQFNARQLPSSVYFYRIQTESFFEVKKMILMK